MRIVFMGSPEFAVPSLESLVQNQYEVTAVYTQPDKPAGRGMALGVSPVKRAAQKLGLPVMQPVNLKLPEEAARLAAFKPDVIVVAAYGRILPKAVLELPRYKCLNIHPSLLPRHRGTAPVTAAILAGDEFTGVTIMVISEVLDTGPVLSRIQVPVTGHDTTGSLMGKLSLISASLIQDVLIRWVRSEIEPCPQDETKATYFPPLKKQDGEINWRLPAVEIWRRVRAYQPWPGAFTRWQGKRLEIKQSVPLPWAEHLEVGQVVDLAKVTSQAAFGVATGDGLLGVCYLQLEGKRPVSADEFLRGQRGWIGAQLPS